MLEFLQGFIDGHNLKKKMICSCNSIDSKHTNETARTPTEDSQVRWKYYYSVVRRKAEDASYKMVTPKTSTHI